MQIHISIERKSANKGWGDGINLVWIIDKNIKIKKEKIKENGTNGLRTAYLANALATNGFQRGYYVTKFVVFDHTFQRHTAITKTARMLSTLSSD